MAWPKPAEKTEAAASPGPRRLMDIAGFAVSPLSFGENVALIMQAAATGQGLWVMTLNLEMAARAATDARYSVLVRDVDLAVADGMPIVLLSRLGLTPLRIPDRSCGVDIVAHCLVHFRGRMGILGGRTPYAALEKLKVDPDKIVFVEDGTVDPAGLDDIIIALKATRCQLLFVALGVPKQDMVCRALRKACPSLVCIGVGGSFSILGGFLPRAPRIMRDYGFEWLFRLIQEPRRLAHRYLLLYPQVIPSLYRWIRRAHIRRRSSPLTPAARLRGDRFVQR
jgi:N-acetylglucosaminyldiphosphoundecaprenol N-acetyl-beta-D-mannosaminyltransferase